jgi:hypothetical protein
MFDRWDRFLKLVILVLGGLAIVTDLHSSLEG